MKKNILYLTLLLFTYTGFSQTYLMQNGTVTTCSGTFFDSGGAAANYGNNQDFTFTICSANPTDAIRVAFTAFNIEQYGVIAGTPFGEQLFIYDGPDTSSPQIGTFYTGTTSPGIVTGSTAGGCLTFRFISDVSVSRPGWRADVTCVPPPPPPPPPSADCSPLFAGDDQIIDCSTPCTTLEAFVIGIPNQATNVYRVGQPVCPLPPITGGSLTNVTSDDTWSQVYNIGFPFNFYGNTYNQFVVNGNGQLSFNTAFANTGSGYVIGAGDLLPTTNGTFDLNTIYGAFHDMDVGNQPGRPEQINFFVSGVAPFRALVMNFDNIEHFGFSCTGNFTTQQIILYETNNVIEVNIVDKPACTAWNGGRATLGIQGNNLTQFSVPPGRNTGVWTATNEQWRFIPDGPIPAPSTFEWFDITAGAPGVSVGTGQTLNVCPPPGVNTYRCVMTYTLPNGNLDSIFDDVVVTKTGNSNLVVNLGPDINTCDNTTPIVLDATQTVPATYQWFFNTAPIPAPAGTAPTFTVNPPNSGLYRVEVTDPADPLCLAADDIVITFGQQPVANQAQDISQCMNNIFDLTVNNPIILGGQNAANFTITYHISLADAQSGNAPIANPTAYPIATPPTQPIFARIADTATGVCSDTTMFEISNAGATAGPMTDVSYCDDDQDGRLIVDLPALKDAEALNGQPMADFNVTYHASIGAAMAGTGAFPPLYNVQGPSELIFVRVTNITFPTCYETDSFTITINPLPIANQPPDQFQCDNGTSNGIFDLTQDENITLGGQNPTLFDITYYTTPGGAMTGTGAIVNPTAYPIFTPPMQTIYVRVADVNSGLCFALTQFDIIYGQAMVGFLTDVTFCDQDNDGFYTVNSLPALKNVEALNGQDPNLFTVTYHLSLQDAQMDINNIGVGPYNAPAPSQPIFVRVEKNNSVPACFATGSFTIFVDSPPTINQNPTPLIACDPDNDGFTDFTLHTADADITNGDLTLTVTYHGTLLDAQNNVNELIDDYTNVVAYNQTVFARVESAVSSCYSVTTLQLIVRDSPMLVAPTPLRLCDDNNDGVEIFDLRVKEPEMLGGANPTLYDFYYYEIEQDAIDAGMAAITAPNYLLAIGTPTAYQNTSNPQTIYVLAVGNASFTAPNNGGTGCFDIVPLQLFVDPMPVAIQPLPYELCDDEINGSTLTDERSTFNLNSRVNEITGNNPNFTVTFYETVADEIANNPIATPNAYQNRAIAPADGNPQTLVVRVSNSFNCKSLTTLTLIVNPNPSPQPPIPLEVCDDDNDGFADFDLNDASIQIIGGEPNVTISYYLTQADAILGTNQGLIVGGIYTNDNPFNDFVWARLVNTITGCFTVIRLDLIVNPIPDAPTTGFGDLTACDQNGGASAEFDLTINTPFVYGSQTTADFTITYHISLADAQNDANAIPNPATFNSTGQTIWVRLENNVTECFRISEFDLIVGQFPIVTTPPDLILCDDMASGSPTDTQSVFNLTLNTAVITGSDPNASVQYFASAADLAAGTFISPANAYTNTSTPQTIFFTVTNGTGCRATGQFDLIVNPNPSPQPPIPLEVCDDDNDGFAEFDLTDADAQIIGGEPNVSITYYQSQATAILGGFQGLIVGGIYTNDNPFNDSVWARLVNSVTGCFTVIELPLIVNPIPDAPTPDFGDLTSCDMNGGTSAEFDLTINTPFVYGTQAATDFTITFHTTLPDAQNDANAIPNPDTFNSTGQTIWVRLENNVTGCFRISEFDLIVGQFPVITTPPDLQLCDDLASGSTTDNMSVFDLTENTSTITGGNTNLSVLYFESQANQTAGIPINPDTAYPNTSTPQTIFFTVTNGTGCMATGQFDIIVNPAPSVVTPAPIEVCNLDNDGTAFFDLTLRNVEIINGEPGVSLTFYETLVDAQNAVFAIDETVPYENIILNQQTIYVRATYDTPPNTTGCFTVVELLLIVNPTPVVPLDIPDLVFCDTDNDGFAIFNLTDRAADIYGTQSTADFVLTYYTTLADAEAGTNAIATPQNYPNTSNPQTIFVRLEDNVTACIKTGSFDLVVSLGAPINPPAPLVKCDDLGEPFDGFTEFDLTVAIPDITGGALGQGVYFYETQADAQADINRIEPANAYTNTSNPQDVFVRKVDGNTECVSFTTLRLRVSPNPDPEDPDPIELCDITMPGDGVEIFNLTIRQAQILDGETWDVTYHETLAFALAGTDAIVDPTMYPNISSPQIIYVRVTNPASTCFEIVELQLVVNPLPDDTAVIEPFIKCIVNNDGTEIFDLTEKIEEILNGQDPTDFTVTFYEVAADAAIPTNAIVDPDMYQNTSNPQTIFVGIRNNATQCYIGGVLSFEIEVREGATANTPAGPYVICDNLDENDGIASFDLQDPAIAGQILGSQTTPPFVLTYYETLENAMEGNSALPNPYVNIINPQVVYARVTNSDTECFAITEVILKVDQLPLFDLEDSYRLCVDENGNPIMEEEGDPSPPLIDTGLDPSQFTFVWELDGVIITSEVGASITPTEGGEYTVTVTSNATGCMSSDTTTVTVSSPPFVFDAVVTTDAFASAHIIEATAEGLGTYIFQLDDGPFQDSGIFTGVMPGSHTVTIKDANGCGSVTLEVNVVDYPLFFTPNQDGFHDTWNIIGIGQTDPTAKIYIFDRFGKLLKQISPISNGWDGTYNGNPLPSSDYWFRVEYKEDDAVKQFRGHFTLKR